MRKKRSVKESDIVKEFVEIAFSEETKNSDRLRALDWLADYIAGTKAKDEVLKKLDDVLGKIESGF